jgi:hypothetical protein
VTKIGVLQAPRPMRLAHCEKSIIVLRVTSEISVDMHHPFRGRYAVISPIGLAPAGVYGTEAAAVFTQEGSFGPVTAFVSKWKVGIAAQPIGIPGYAGAKYLDFDADGNFLYPNQTNQRIQLANFQLWTDLYVDDLGSVIDKFIGADGKPVNPAVAIDALGTPVYDIRGPASGIATNLGSGGDFTKTGTVSDVTTGP